MVARALNAPFILQTLNSENVGKPETFQFIDRALDFIVTTINTGIIHTLTVRFIAPGPLPRGLGQLTSLEELRLNQNSFSGSIPDDMLASASLLVVDLSSNCLEGKVRLKTRLLLS